MVKKEFYYSQNSLGIYNFCPKKFEYVYIENLSGIEELVEVREKIELGTKFHILAERYFNGMNDYFYVKEEKLKEWMSILENYYPMDLECRSEYEVKQNKDGLKILAKYDLIVEEGNKLKIIDFKTNKKVYRKEKLEESIQTKIYMFLLGENINKINSNLFLENLEMEYFQLNFPEEKIKINYTKEKHEKNRTIIKKIVSSIENSRKNGFKKIVGECHFCKFRAYCKK